MWLLKSPPASMSPIAMTSSGSDSVTLTQKRRVIETSSGFGGSSSVTCRGSRAIPQIGQLPGSERTISGCIGQTYSTRMASETVSGSRAIPHFGHAPGVL
jgi:hypothetical protein